MGALGQCLMLPSMSTEQPNLNCTSSGVVGGGRYSSKAKAHEPKPAKVLPCSSSGVYLIQCSSRKIRRFGKMLKQTQNSKKSRGYVMIALVYICETALAHIPWYILRYFLIKFAYQKNFPRAYLVISGELNVCIVLYEV